MLGWWDVGVSGGTLEEEELTEARLAIQRGETELEK